MITAVSHVTLFVHDQEKALTFYTNILGFKKHTDTMFDKMRWLTINPEKQPTFEIALKLAENAQEKALVGKQAASTIFLALISDSCLKDFEHLQSKGVKFHGIPQKQPWGISVELEDLYGNKLYMVELT